MFSSSSNTITVTLSQPSAAVLDSGQSETYSATVYNGIGPLDGDSTIFVRFA